MKDVYPYLVTAGYPIDVASGRSVPIGNGIYEEYVIDRKGLVESMDISKVRDPNEVKAAAIGNLKDAFKTKLKAMSFPNGPENKAFILIGDHWTAATQILNPELYSWAGKTLKGERFILAIPNRETMLIFSDGDDNYRDAVKQFVKQKESDNRKPLTFDLFLLDEYGPKPLK